MVRGGPVLNDVTVTEARQVGLDEYARIVSSGKAIAGTEIEYPLSRSQRKRCSAQTLL